MRKFPDTAAIILVLVLIVGGQIAAKIGSAAADRPFLGINSWLALSYLLFLARGTLWAWVLRHNPVSRVYPFLALAYPLVLLSGIMFFDESISVGKFFGTLCILAGSLLLIPEGRG